MEFIRWFVNKYRDEIIENMIPIAVAVFVAITLIFFFSGSFIFATIAYLIWLILVAPVAYVFISEAYSEMHAQFLKDKARNSKR